MASDDWESDGEFEASILQMDGKQDISAIVDGSHLFENKLKSSDTSSVVSVFPKVKGEPAIPSCSTPRDPKGSMRVGVKQPGM